MKVRLLKQVSISPTEVGAAGQEVEMPEDQARDFIRAKLAEAVEEKPAKESKPAENRATKPGKGPTETK